jgi:hypothetical protein
MAREAARTLYSLSPVYQRDVEPAAYESPSTMAPPNRSPVEAIRLGVSAALGEAVAIVFDGARTASPGLVRLSLSDPKNGAMGR